MQDDVVGLYRLGCDVPEVLGIVQLIEIAANDASHLAGQLHGVGQHPVTGLLPVKLPCVVLPGALQVHITFPETVRPGRAGHPQKRPVLGLVAGSGPPDDLFVDLKIVAIKGGVLPHELFQRGQNIHILKPVHGVTPPIPVLFPAAAVSSAVPPWRL